MVRKFHTLGVLAAALIVLPTTAFAQSTTRQEINQSGTAEGYRSQVNQSAKQRSSQRRDRVGSPYYNGCRSEYGSQRADQRINQNGYAADGSLVDQNAEQQNSQRQETRRNCR
ncbi:hypothetical protein [Mastigocladopsis repens]|uniref:hypothetical protein n=1 Tax=Mastigocladopsis repens TaxID=221287 RepID=UPI00031A770E|nr:hypothetical protein [Mastigocladopsis repens]